MHPTADLNRLGRRPCLVASLFVSCWDVAVNSAVPATQRNRLGRPDMITTLPHKTMLAFADHGRLRGEMPTHGRDAEAMLADFVQVGADMPHAIRANDRSARTRLLPR